MTTTRIMATLRELRFLARSLRGRIRLLTICRLPDWCSVHLGRSGPGLYVKDTRKVRLVFSERNGYIKGMRLGPYWIGRIRAQWDWRPLRRKPMSASECRTRLEPGGKAAHRAWWKQHRRKMAEALARRVREAEGE